MYKTLPGPIRPKEEKNPDHHTHSPLFGLNLNLNFSKMISSGVNFFDNLRKKTPSTPTHSNSESGSLSSPSISSTCSADPSSPALYGEAIEMTSFPPGVVALAAGTGAGHVWSEVGTHNPTWCDLCGEMIWGLYQTGAWQCTLCSYTSHIKCRDKISLDCSASQRANRDSGSEADEDEDDTDGMIQSLLLDDSDPEEDEVGNLSTASYATARADTLTAATMGTNTTRYLSFTSNTTTLVEDKVRQEEDQFHTLQDVAELTNDPVPSLLSLPPEELTRLLDTYNSSLPLGQGTAWDPEHNCFRGYIRVDMNLARPINVISGTRPPSIYNIMAEDTVNDRTLTTFYLPPGTEKALHITSQTTTQDVIRVLLKKFRVADNPHKYALYERQDEHRRDSFPRSKSLSRLKMRRLPEEEKPLVLAVLWGSLAREEQGGTKFVLQENDPGEIQWDQFSFPELKNFLLILDREEAWYKRRIHEKYETVQDTIHQLLQEKRPEPV